MKNHKNSRSRQLAAVALSLAIAGVSTPVGASETASEEPMRSPAPQTSESVCSEKPAVSENPIVSATPEKSETPVVSEKPAPSKAPEDGAKPTVSENPAVSPDVVVSSAPVCSEKPLPGAPDDSSGTKPTEKPAVTQPVVPTKRPVATATELPLIPTQIPSIDQDNIATAPTLKADSGMIYMSADAELIPGFYRVITGTGEVFWVPEDYMREYYEELYGIEQVVLPGTISGLIPVEKITSLRKYKDIKWGDARQKKLNRISRNQAAVVENVPKTGDFVGTAWVFSAFVGSVALAAACYRKKREDFDES